MAGFTQAGCARGRTLHLEPTQCPARSLQLPLFGLGITESQCKLWTPTAEETQTSSDTGVSGPA